MSVCRQAESVGASVASGIVGADRTCFATVRVADLALTSTTVPIACALRVRRAPAKNRISLAS